MNKETYMARLREVEKSESELRRKRLDILSEYMNANKPFEIGEKVVVTFNNGKEDLAFVSGYYLDFDKTVCAEVLQSKKDGSPSKKKYFEMVHKKY